MRGAQRVLIYSLLVIKLSFYISFEIVNSDRLHAEPSFHVGCIVSNTLHQHKPLVASMSFHLVVVPSFIQAPGSRPSSFWSWSGWSWGSVREDGAVTRVDLLISAPFLCCEIFQSTNTANRPVTCPHGAVKPETQQIHLIVVDYVSHNIAVSTSDG